ncbi:amino acid adenylation domain-containing protein [Oculatella sp. LEGE 06141]|uniref:non-ribosomal peptide synthetase n=1 Tax=Oculatella sp. LEGE 06141 TaxID=1828648 RepID=UPI00187E8F84|nr:non-ribosomal peptide synthetase [Oculatella sp. LEGE 06141]MBE9178531.1 amino acid adenylation domain-containing protein [Oculatella sp. LEGE 06141]
MSLDSILNNVEDIYPLSPMQQGMLFHSLYAPESGVYVEQTSFDLQGSLNRDALVAAWKQLMVWHTVLRTAFVWEKLEHPIQIVGRQVELPWQELNWTGFSPMEQQEKLEQLLQTDAQQGFDLTQAPLMRLTLIHKAESAYQLIWSHHHLLLDGWSVQLVFQDLLTAYASVCRGTPLERDRPPYRNSPYRNYIAWLQQQDLSQAKAFWQRTLKGLTASISLGIDRKPQALQQPTQTYAQQQIHVSSAITVALKSLAHQHRLTLNTLIQGVWAWLLSYYSGETDVVFGATVSGRPPTLPHADAMVGLFINTLPVRVQVAPDSDLLSWLQQLQHQQVEARQYDYTPLMDIQRWSNAKRGVPLFDTLLVFENYPMNASQSQDSRDLNIRKVDSIETTNYPLTVMAGVDPDLWLRIVYEEQRFEAAAIARLLTHLQTLLETIAANPQQRLSELSCLTATERQTLLLEWNQTQVDFQYHGIHQRIEAQVEKTPEAIALTFNDQHLTYRELNARANQLAHYLQTLGITPDDCVGLCLERSLEMVVGLLAVLKAGAAYVPFDPSYPSERLAFMLRDTQVPILLTQSHLIETLPDSTATILCLDRDGWAIASSPATNPVSAVAPDHLAYVIYTSGSTGQPKGAMNTHRGLSNRLQWMQQAYGLDEGDRVLQKTPFSFDVSVWEFFWPLMTGARLVVAQPGGHQDSAYLVRLINQEQITTLHFVPSMLQAFLEEPDLDRCPSLRRVICSGEALPVALQERFFARLSAELHNLYGPTEAAIDVTAWQCDPQSDLTTVPMGHPIANTQIYLLDKTGNPVPIGVPGELHIGGVGLARGYWQRPGLTAEKFVPNPFWTTDSHSDVQSSRLYKTGDLARYLPDGTIEFLGRMDHQVKLRGFRIELGEVEAVLEQYPGIRQAVVTLQSTSQGDRLVAYLINNQHPKPTDQDLRAFLSQTLPAYMVPPVFLWLEALPLTPNGKIDRKALPIPERLPSRTTHVIPPQTVTENQLAAIWQDLLEVESLSVDHNFFELGGHSLLALRLVSRVRDIFRLELPLRIVFDYPTLTTLAEQIERLHQIQKLHIPAFVAESYSSGEGLYQREEIEL